MSAENAASAGTVLLHGGTVRTMIPDAGPAEAILLRDGRVAATGSATDLRHGLDRPCREIALEGRTVLPGLIDSHPHLLHYGTLQAPLVDLADASCHAEIVERIAARAAEVPAGDWIMCSPVGEGHYFVARSWRDLAEGRLPDRAVLDRATAEHPVMIQAWAPVTPNVIAFNSAALARLEIGPEIADRIGDVWIEKDREGRPTGLLTGSLTNYFCNDAFGQDIWRRIPFLQAELMLPATERAMRDYNAQGVTAVYENHMMDPPLLDVYRRLRREDRLTLRVMLAQEAESYGMPWSRPRGEGEFVRRIEEAAGQVELADPLLRFDGVTFTRDGSCWPGGMQMKEPYLGPYGEMTSGRAYIAPERAAQAMRLCADLEMRLNTIALGTAAQEQNLAQLEAVAADADIGSLDWLLVHAMFVEPEQARRYARLGMNVTTCPSFVYGKGELFRRRMKENVLADLLPLRRFLDNGMTVACGSDWGPKNAFRQIEISLTHAFGGSERNNLGPAQRITREEALAMWTRNAARILRWQGIGTLAPGDHADLIVVDRDPLTCPVEQIGGTRVDLTLLGGEPVYRSGGLPF